MSFPAGPDELTPAWIEDVLRRDGGLVDASVRNLRAEVIGVGFGLDGKSARVTLDGDGGIPATLVAKWSKAKTARSETRFYREIGPSLELRLARLFASFVDDEGNRALLLLSDVAPAKQGDVLVGLTLAEAEAMTDAMAGFHAAFWRATDDPVIATLPAWGNSERSVRRLRERMPRFLAEWEGRLPPAAIAAAHGLPARVERAYASLSEAPSTLVHADLHADNVLFAPDGTPVILDWTDMARGPSAIDFARLFAESMTSDLVRKHRNALTNRYAVSLAARGVTDYGLVELRRHVADSVAVMFAAAVNWVAGPDALGPDVPRVPLVVESLVRRSADAAAEWAP